MRMKINFNWKFIKGSFWQKAAIGLVKFSTSRIAANGQQPTLR